jgi:hypothetical protein
VFSIEIRHEVEQDEDSRYYRGLITIGDYEESFLAASGVWDWQAYERQWRAAARRLLKHRDRTAFVTSFSHPDAHHNFAWLAWCEQNLVYLQNRLLLREFLPSVLDVDRIDEVVGSRETVTEDGEEISQWTVSLADIAVYAA